MVDKLPPEETEAASEDVPAVVPMGLTFADGVQFGCGFMLAVTLSMMILALAVLAVVLLLSLAGISIF